MLDFENFGKLLLCCVKSTQSYFVASDEEEHIVSRIEQQFHHPLQLLHTVLSTKAREQQVVDKSGV